MQKITLHKDLTAVQIEFCNSLAHYKLYRAGRQGGKTEVLVWDWGKWAFIHANTTNWYVAQDLANLKEKVIPQFEKSFDHRLILDYSKSDKCYTLFNGAKCYFKSGNSADGLRGRGVHNLAIDEAAFIVGGASVFHDILRPQLITTNGRLEIGSSPPSKKAPTGAEWFRRLEQSFREEIAAGHNEYAIFHSTLDDNPFVPSHEKERIKRTTDAETYQVEYMGEYNDKVGQVYWEFDPLSKKRVLTESDNILMRVRGLDWGLEDNTGCAWIALLPNNRIHIYDEHVENNLDVPEQADRIKVKTRSPVAWTCLDSSCWNRLPGVESVARRFAMAGIQVMPATKDFDGSTSDVKVMFSEGYITIDPKCVHTLQAIQDWQWGQHEPDILAGMRYGINALIRAGKLLPPIRTHKPKTIQERWQEMDKLDRRTRELNAKFFSTHKKPIQSFKVIR